MNADTLALVADDDGRGAKSLCEPYRGNLARKLKGLRSERAISQTAFAERVGISQPQLSAVERGTGSVGINVLIRMRAILSVSLDDLLGLPELKTTRMPEDLKAIAAEVAKILATSTPESESPPERQGPDNAPEADPRRLPPA